MSLLSSSLLRVATLAGCVAFQSRLELVHGVRTMHLMAGQATQFSFSNASLVAGRANQTVVLASAYPNRSIAKKNAFDVSVDQRASQPCLPVVLDQ
jgi:hypothetical protein